MKEIGVGILVFGMVGAAMADAVAWPADFWAQVSTHVAVTAPAGAQVGQASNAEEFGSFAWADMPGGGFGTVSAPFDSICWLRFVTDAILLDTRPPAGATILFR